MARIAQMPIPTERRTEYKTDTLTAASADTTKIIDRMERDLFFANIAILPVISARNPLFLICHKVSVVESSAEANY